METRQIHDQMVIATKVNHLFRVLSRLQLTSNSIYYCQYTTDYKHGDTTIKHKATYIGNHVKSMHLSVEASLKKLRTDYINIFYIHWWDYTTSIEEVMNGLHNLVAQGKVLYLVRLSLSLTISLMTHNAVGCFRYSRVGCCKGKHLCQAHRQDPLRHLSRWLEYSSSRPGARNSAYGERGR